MTTAEILDVLRRHQPELQAKGVRHAGLFGSTARGEAGPGSDIDIMIDLDPEVRMTVYDYVGIKEYIADLFEDQVDVVSREGLKPYVSGNVIRDLIPVF